MNKRLNKEYLEIIKARGKKSKVHKAHQLAGLIISRLLNDEANKELYMRLAKEHDNSKLLGLARDISLRKSVKNRGAYFMRMFQRIKQEGGFRKILKEKKKKQMRLKLKIGKKK